MAAQTGIDIAWATPTVDQIKATGARWVARYFSPDVTKNLTASEVKAYTAAGLGIVTVWEGAATRALQGYAAGVDDAKAARAQRATVGLPDSMPIHFAVDTDTSWASVAAYFNGVISVLGLDLVGAYGGLHVIEGAHSVGIRYLWQTVAWSGGVWAPYATIRQPGGTTLSGGADFDTAETPDFGQYPSLSGGDMALTNSDAFTVWAYKGPGDSPDVHQTLENAAAQSKANGAALSAVKAELDAVKAELDGIKATLAGLSAVQLTDAQVQALAAQIGPVLAPALLSAMGHKLDGTSA